MDCKRSLIFLRAYLNEYTTALKGQRFRLTYVDAFAGEGVWRPRSAYTTEVYGDYRKMVI